ncbi:hypothetical protein CRYUN_Cryun30bG0034400 [Craigia yunnanensis]
MEQYTSTTAISQYEGGKPDATFSFKDDDFIKVGTGKMNPQIAFMRGVMKIKGSLSAAQKFTRHLPKACKDVSGDANVLLYLVLLLQNSS